MLPLIIYLIAFNHTPYLRKKKKGPEDKKFISWSLFALDTCLCTFECHIFGTMLKRCWNYTSQVRFVICFQLIFSVNLSLSENALQINCTCTEAIHICQNRLPSQCVWFTMVFVSNYCQYSEVMSFPQLFNSGSLKNGCS